MPNYISPSRRTYASLRGCDSCHEFHRGMFIHPPKWKECQYKTLEDRKYTPPSLTANTLKSFHHGSVAGCQFTILSGLRKALFGRRCCKGMIGCHPTSGFSFFQLLIHNNFATSLLSDHHERSYPSFVHWN